jgi:hypothetical protein
MQAAAPLLNAIPYVGPVLSAGASIAGAAMANKSATAGLSAGASKLGQMGASAPDTGAAMQRKVEPVQSDQATAQIQDAQQAAKQMPPAIRQQAEPVLDAAYEEVLRRRLGGLYGNN